MNHMRMRLRDIDFKSGQFHDFPESNDACPELHSINLQNVWQVVPKDGGHGTSVATDKVLDLRGPLSKSSRVLVTESKAEKIAKKHRKSQHASFH